jgi:glycosyltransferase involved in cell wall biosynthesis
MARILVISFSDLQRDPRVRRQINALRQEHTITTVGLGDPQIAGVGFISCALAPRTLARKIMEAAELALHRYEQYYWSLPQVIELQAKLADVDFELIVANDVDTLPVALRVAGTRPVVIDAHEYAPRQFEDKLVWRLTRQGFAQHLCFRYLNRAAAMTTVCDGIALEYRRNFAVEPAVVSNAAPFHDLPLRPTSPSKIRLIHHGGATPSRRIEGMIDMMDLADERFSLDLILVPGYARYIARIRQRAAGNPRIRFLDPVPMDKIVELSAGYDVGLFLLPPTNFNYAMALPNKLFEFIQARLAVAIGPSTEMARIVREFECGIVADDFGPATLARALNSLTAVDVDRMKAGSEKAAHVYTAENNAEKMREIVTSVLKEF